MSENQNNEVQDPAEPYQAGQAVETESQAEPVTGVVVPVAPQPVEEISTDPPVETTTETTESTEKVTESPVPEGGNDS